MLSIEALAVRQIFLHSPCFLQVDSMCNVVKKARAMCRFISACACTRSYPGIFSLLIHSLVSNESVSGQRRHWSDRADAQVVLAFPIRLCPKTIFRMARSRVSINCMGAQADLSNHSLQMHQGSFFFFFFSLSLLSARLIINWRTLLSSIAHYENTLIQIY